jgi:hypothetical protein
VTGCGTVEDAGDYDDPRIDEAEWKRDHATNDDAPRGWGECPS